MVDIEERWWRNVPKVNVTHSRQDWDPRRLALRGLLVAVVVAGAILVWNQRSLNTDIEGQINSDTIKLGRLQSSLSTGRQEVQELFAQISQLQEAQNANKQSVQMMAGSATDWHGALAPLFEAQTEGVVFQSVSAGPSGQVLLGGQADTKASMSSLPSRLMTISGALDFQSIQWETGAEVLGPPQFSAAFQVRK